MKEIEKLSSSSTRLLLAAVFHFFSINDVILNRKKISKFTGEHENKFEYRSYNHEEISRLLGILDERGKVAVLLMASTGMRVGGLTDIRLKHIQKWNLGDSGSNFVYRITVYGGSSKHKYTTFCSPEAAVALDEYLYMRKRHGENLKYESETGNWIPGETPLIIRQFNKTDFAHKILPLKPMTITTKIIASKLSHLGIRNKIVLTKSISSKKAAALNKHELHPCHSLRIFAITQMQRAKVDKTIREMLVGHSTGLDSVYYKPQEEEILEEYLKAVDLLTINKEHRLQKQILEYKQKSDGLQEIRQKLDENYEEKIRTFKIEMENKFKEMFQMVDIKKLN